MTKLRSPLLSLNARGRLSKLFSLARRQGQNIIERRPSPTDAKSPAQLFNRHMFTKCVDLWHLLSSAEQQEWESLARPRHMSGYAWYISQCLRPNPGIYLPLQGGTMQGIIDMAGYPIQDLKDPVAVQDAATKAYHDANKYTDAEVNALIALHTAIAAAHHARYTDGEADARITLHAAIAAAHHARYTDAEVDAIADALIATHAALVTNVHGAGDSVLATTLNIATHAAIAAAHHARYTDAEVDAIADALIATHAALPNVHHTPPGAGAALTIAETEVFSGNAPNPSAWTDLDLSGTIGSNAALVMLKFYAADAGIQTVAVRKNGDTDEFYIASYSGGCSGVDTGGVAWNALWVPTSDSGIIEWKWEAAGVATTIDVMAYIK